MGADAPMVKNGRAIEPWVIGASGCSCCTTKPERRRTIKSVKAKEKAAWKKREGVR